MTDSNVHLMTELTAQALDLVEAGTDPQRLPEGMAMCLELASNPASACLVGPLAGMLSELVLQLAKASGHDVPTIMAHLRRVAGDSIASADRAFRQGRWPL